ncbi:SAM-dependent methyltransferase [Paenibacillus profundus]|uniref:SAM-dependent methyltransferase n=1 Tax=Paenibacillus profundus TaxID=1173085 RepID=A0ABS8YD44_9BACL|nr:SAM-dependent methyltransferase [Paenibacillus profundus]MCE5169938.1 SAM-dependent methyltransferase [Paenibacillus profundus]
MKSHQKESGLKKLGAGTDNQKLDLSRIVFIGRTYEEYIGMFNLSVEQMAGKRILDCAGGACSFTAHANRRGIQASACDIAYEFKADDLERKGIDDLNHTMENMGRVADQYVWSYFSSLKALQEERARALHDCVQDMREQPGRYQAAALPTLPYADKQFDMSLNAHLLFMYSDRLDYEFHLTSLVELIRVTKDEIRIFPLTDLSGRKYEHLDRLLHDVQACIHSAHIEKSSYEFQRGANELLSIRLQS